MAASYNFHPEALAEYEDAALYYLREASEQISGGFIATVESAVASVVANPTRWRVVEEPEIRRYVFDRFPFAIYYRWEPRRQRIVIYAVMHCSREPGYWRHRVEADDQ